MEYKITRITRQNGQPATDTDSIRRIGRTVQIKQLELGLPMILRYDSPDDDRRALITSQVIKIRERSGHTMQVTTRHHNYYLRGQETTR